LLDQVVQIKLNVGGLDGDDEGVADGVVVALEGLSGAVPAVDWVNGDQVLGSAGVAVSGLA
jgi:hypothetical protein